ncbi:hypothetical protein GE061_020298, partial [Apolygus lucorum]
MGRQPDATPALDVDSLATALAQKLRLPPVSIPTPQEIARGVLDTVKPLTPPANPNLAVQIAELVAQLLSPTYSPIHDAAAIAEAILEKLRSCVTMSLCVPAQVTEVPPEPASQPMEETFEDQLPDEESNHPAQERQCIACNRNRAHNSRLWCEACRMFLRHSRKATAEGHPFTCNNAHHQQRPDTTNCRGCRAKKLDALEAEILHPEDSDDADEGIGFRRGEDCNPQVPPLRITSPDRDEREIVTTNFELPLPEAVPVEKEGSASPLHQLPTTEEVQMDQCTLEFKYQSTAVRCVEPPPHLKPFASKSVQCNEAPPYLKLVASKYVQCDEPPQHLKPVSLSRGVQCSEEEITAAANVESSSVLHWGEKEPPSTEVGSLTAVQREEEPDTFPACDLQLSSLLSSENEERFSIPDIQFLLNSSLAVPRTPTKSKLRREGDRPTDRDRPSQHNRHSDLTRHDDQTRHSEHNRHSEHDRHSEPDRHSEHDRHSE